MGEALWVLITAILLTSCVSVGNQSLQQRADDWPPMEYTKAKMVAELGPPTGSVVSEKDGKTTETLTWSYTHVEPNPALFIPIVGLFVPAGDAVEGEARSLSATFDNGKMIQRAWSNQRIGNPPSKPTDFWKKK